MNLNTFVVDSLVESVMNECESIIAETENVEEYTTGDMLDVVHFYDIRLVAEELQSFVVHISENEFISNSMLEQLDDISITLYQNVKYILEDCEIEIFSTTDTEIMKSFDNMRTYVNNVRETVSTFVESNKI
jgi:hypothetical protein